MKNLIEVRDFTIPDNWHPKDPQAVKRWMAKLPMPYDLKKCMEADKRYNHLRSINGV